MGILFRVVYYAEAPESSKSLEDEVLERIQQLDRILSDYKKESEVNQLVRLPAGTSHRASRDLFTVLKSSEVFAHLSGGAFDVTAGPLINLWRRARSTGELPTAQAIQAARMRTGYSRLSLSEAEQSVLLKRAGMALDLGGIAKGYVVDQILKILRTAGIESSLVDAGGDVAVGAPPPGQTAWIIAIRSDENGDNNPRLRLVNSAVATSGDIEQYATFNGRRYSHIIDPRTGEALVDSNLVTVVAPTAMEADAWATTLSVLPPDEGLGLLPKQPGYSARILLSDPGHRVILSDGFPLTNLQKEPN
jgi:thiamine biosynthesis lipoprotein